uniref:Venom protein n=1 Tax=Meloidogyne hapla TaxID=6305 RepID=A0A1I8BGU3_MELHA
MDRMMRKMAKRSRRSAEQNEGEEVKEEDKGEEIAEKVPKKKKNNKNKGDKKKGKKKSKKESLKRILKEENNQTSILRTWHNWVGQYKNRLTGIAKSEFFSTRNQRFAASYLKPGQRSTLTGRVLSGEQANIRFWVWEATRDLQLRVCCDDTGNEEQCVFQTDKGVKRGSRRWIEQTATCPQGTKKIIFECRNLGRFQGACGLDNIQLLNNYCPSITSTRITRK